MCFIREEKNKLCQSLEQNIIQLSRVRWGFCTDVGKHPRCTIKMFLNESRAIIA